MAFEFSMLLVMTLFFLFAWLPSSVGKYQSYGTKWLASNREIPKDKVLAPWAGRAERAYNNLKDYFPAYVVAILVLGATNQFTAGTQWAAALYVVGRVLHFICYCYGHVLGRASFFFLALFSNLYLLIAALT